MFRALLDHHQEAPQTRHLVYCARVMSVGCISVGVELVSETYDILLRSVYTVKNCKFGCTF
jgi:hypothetical protein